MNKKNVDIRFKLANRFRSSISSIFTIAIFTLINLVLIVAKSDTYFLFTAQVPYFITYLGAYVCGMLSPEIYGENLAFTEFLPGYVFAIALIFSVIILGIYALCGFLGRKGKLGWLITALVLFSLDCVFILIIGGTFMDYAFHIWALVSIILGITALVKLRKLPPEEELAEEETVEENTDDPENVIDEEVAVVDEDLPTDNE